MKLLATAFFALTAFAQATDPAQTNFNFGQATVGINLEYQDFETIYRTDQVPDTCYRDEIQGTRTQCHTEYDRVCNTRYEHECNYRNYPICERIPRNVCQTEENCRTRMDHVCNSRGCTDVPRRECAPVQRCSTQYDNVCHNDQRYECNDVPRQYCENIPREACQQVPNVVSVAYACTRPVQVAVGQRLKLHTIAKVTVNLLNFAETGAIADVLTAQLNANGIVSLRSTNPNAGFLFQMIAQQRTEQVVSATEKIVNYSFSIKATSIAKLNSFLNSELVGNKLFVDRLEFELNTYGAGIFTAPLQGHLKLVQMKNSRKGYILIDDDFDAKSMVTRGGTQVMMFKPFGIDDLIAKNHSIELSLSVDLKALKKDLINPEVLPLISNKQIEASFEAIPNQ